MNKSLVFHAGTSIDGADVITSGGRVIAVTSLADSISSAVSQTLESASNIKFGNSYFRTDIGRDLM
jgi:phosphoribosylamine--glycine ligase